MNSVNIKPPGMINLFLLHMNNYNSFRMEQKYFQNNYTSLNGYLIRNIQGVKQTFHLYSLTLTYGKSLKIAVM